MKYPDDFINQIICGDCIETMKAMPDNSVDAIVTDPPYELGFMGKKWDSTGIAHNVDLWRECLRVLKPGGHLLAFGGTRTYHRMACAIEDAGFEVRDMLEWVYFSGFPKSLNIGKAVDKLQGNERKIFPNPKAKQQTASKGTTCYGDYEATTHITKGNSEWEGFGTALKPAHEPICMARKPLSEKTIVENVLKHGTGALDIEGCRIPTSKEDQQATLRANTVGSGRYNKTDGINISLPPVNLDYDPSKGRFPANVIVTDDALNDGVMTGGGKRTIGGTDRKIEGFVCTGSPSRTNAIMNIGDSGSKSRYFDIDVWAEKHGLLQFPKASKSERNKGCEGLPTKTAMEVTGRKEGSKGLIGSKEYGKSKKKKNPYSNSGGVSPRSNHHATVKPVHLLCWLVRLVSKKGDVILDPFAGSCTTALACHSLDRQYICIELDQNYCTIGQSRIAEAQKQWRLL